MIEFLFLDLDDTILDFHKAERIAISKTIREFGVEPTEEILDLYHGINKWHWEQLEQGKLTRAEVLVNRFGVLFERLGQEVDAPKCAKTYEYNLSQGHWFLPAGFSFRLKPLPGRHLTSKPAWGTSFSSMWPVAPMKRILQSG